MAYAQRKVWLEPEEQHEAVVLQSRPPRRRRNAPVAPQRPMAMMLLVLAGVAITVTLVTAYVSIYALTAQDAFHRQSLQQSYAQLNRDCIQLKLETDHLAAQPRLTQVAMDQGLGVPDMKRLHCVRINADPRWAVLAQTTPSVRHTNWMAHSGHQLVAALDGAVQQLKRGPGVPAYAR